MAGPHFIQLIFPLKLEWEPWYSTEEQLSVGQRVTARLAGRSYTAVVSRTQGIPDIDQSRIRPIDAVEDKLEPITENEIRFWRFLSDYYLCTIGEIYRIAYPATYSETEKKRANKTLVTADLPSKHLSGADKELIRRIYEGFGQRQTVLLSIPPIPLQPPSSSPQALPSPPQAPSASLQVTSSPLQAPPASRQANRASHQATPAPLQSAPPSPQPKLPAILAELESRCLEEGRDVLRIRPDAVKPGYVQLRELAKSLRAGTPTLVDCGKSGLFLPFGRLGLVIVEDEHSPEYKQKNAPLFNVRDAALALAAIHGADVLLTSALPSLETLYNVRTGKYLCVSPLLRPETSSPAAIPPSVEIIGTEDEFRKNGMLGSFSRKLLLRMGETLDGGSRVLLLLPWKETREIEIEARTHFPKARTKLKVNSLHAREDYGKYDLVALMRADFMLSRNDFRADEKAYRCFCMLCNAVGDRLVVQTREASHPAFSNDPAQLERLLLERKEFNFPPFTRMVTVELEDSNEPRKKKMEFELARRLGGLQLMLQKDKNLSARKKEIRQTVTIFEKEFRYTGHIIINVDPL